MKQRGIYEREPGSGVWWIVYFDQFGKRRREKAGSKSIAIKLYGKRKQQVLEGKNSQNYFVSHPSISANSLRMPSRTRKGTSDPTRRTCLVLQV